jgi:hypothetical protein
VKTKGVVWADSKTGQKAEPEQNPGQEQKPDRTEPGIGQKYKSRKPEPETERILPLSLQGKDYSPGAEKATAEL